VSLDRSSPLHVAMEIEALAIVARKFSDRL
jgi:hypothetical protein